MTSRKVLALGRLKSGVMNAGEEKYAKHLEALKQAGEVLWYGFEAMTFKLAEGSRYTPDFIVLLSSGELEAHEIKGRWIGDAKTKIKVAAQLFPLRFIALFALPKRDGGGWRVEEY